MWLSSATGRRLPRLLRIRVVSVVVIGSDQAVGGDRGGELSGEQLTAYVVPDRLHAGRVPQPLGELVADQRPGELELLLRALLGDTLLPHGLAMCKDPLPHLVHVGALEPG